MILARTNRKIVTEITVTTGPKNKDPNGAVANFLLDTSDLPFALSEISSLKHSSEDVEANFAK